MTLSRQFIATIGTFEATRFFSHIISNTARFSGKKFTEHKTCVLIFFTTFVTNIPHSKYWAKCDNYLYWSSCKVPCNLVRFYWNLNFLDSFSKNTQISWKSFYWEPSCSMWTDGRTYMTKLIVAFDNFANEPNYNKIRRLCIPAVYIANWRQLRSHLRAEVLSAAGICC